MKRAYHFLPAKYALDNLKNSRIKISRIKDLNDPFELLWMELSNKEDRKAFKKNKKDCNKKYGVICFSKGWSNPVLWSHYADKHRGVCLGFDILEEPVDIKYISRKMLPKFDNGLCDETTKEFLSIKYKGWKYEDEIRILVKLKKADKTGIDYYKKFDRNFILREVILGVGYPNAEAKQYFDYVKKDVKLICGRPAFKSFRIVENKKKTKSPRQLTGPINT